MIDEILNGFSEGYDVDPKYGPIPKNAYEAWIDKTGLKEDQFLDAVALRLASGFASHEFSFPFCSDIIARFEASAFGRWPPFFWDVYIAFDAGEFQHDERKGDDWSETHTRPMIEAILREKTTNDTLPGA